MPHPVIVAQRQAIAYQRLIEAADTVGEQYGVGEQVDALKAVNAKDPNYQQMLQSEALADLVEALAKGDKVAEPSKRSAARKETKAMQDKEGQPADDAPATKDEAVQRVETDLEEDTGKDFVETGKNPPTLAETDETPSGNSEVFSTPPKGKK